jgi:MoaA/NifB/PqqE/SkfB family radical SAM enzyme
MLFTFLMPKRFGKVNIEISNICNLQCSFCPEVIRSPKLMDISLFRKIIEQVGPLTDQVCFHLMGDPLVHPRLAQMVSICEEFRVPIFFVTNGVLLRNNFAEKTELLLNSAFRQVNFSLHSFADNFPEKDPSEYISYILSYTDRALSERPDLYINYRLWNLQTPRSGLASHHTLMQKIEEHFQIQSPQQVDVRKQKSHHIKGRLYLHFDTEFVWPSLELPVLGKKGRCLGLSSHFGILVDGTVVPCCLDKEAAIALGKIQDLPLLEILDSPRAQTLLHGFKNRVLVENLCQRCQYIERF